MYVSTLERLFGFWSFNILPSLDDLLNEQQISLLNVDYYFLQREWLFIRPESNWSEIENTDYAYMNPNIMYCLLCHCFLYDIC